MANVSASELRSYIAKLLEEADLNKVTSKSLRKQCEEKFKVDLTSRKQEVDDIIIPLVHEKVNQQNKNEADEDGDEDENENDEENEEEHRSSESSESDNEEQKKSTSIPHKKLKKPIPENKQNAKVNKPVKKNKVNNSADSSAYSDIDDATLARKLQDEEWNFRQRSTRKAAAKTHNTRHRNKSESEKPRSRKGTSAYTRKCVLSPELAAVMESNEMARPDVVKKMWAIVRERNLFDPSNKQFAICDEQLQKVFGAKRIRVFAMMKYLKNHIKDLK